MGYDPCSPENAIVESPLYGIGPNREFYPILLEDSGSSVLKFNGVFPEKETDRIALLFDYHWTLSGGQTVDFKVADII